MTIRNAVISLAVMVLIAMPIAIFCVREFTDIRLPTALSSNESAFITGKFVEDNIRGTATLGGFKRHEFQDALEAVLDDCIPFKVKVLKDDARLQRSMIALSNTLFHWDCYPTKYGSEYAIWPRQGVIVPFVIKENSANNAAVESFVNAINTAAIDNPSVRFIFQEIIETGSTDANPSHELISNTYGKEWIKKNIEDELDDRVDYLLEDIESEEELSDHWFATDHHWRIEKALQAYDQIAHAAGLKPCTGEQEYVEVASSWTGANARNGICFEYNDYLSDAVHDFSNLKITVDGTEVERGSRNTFINEGEIPFDYSVQYNAYHSYYGAPQSEVIYENYGENNGRNCLFIEQSYGLAIEPYIAENFKRTIAIDPQNCAVERTIEDYIREYDIDDVIIQMGTIWLAKMQVLSPKFLAE